MISRLDTLKAQLLMRAGGFIGQRHEAAWKRAVVRLALRLNLARHGRQPLRFLDDEKSIDLLDYEAEDESEASFQDHSSA